MIYAYAPFYNPKSNGIAIFYELIRILNHAGIEAKVLCYENEMYNFEIPDEIKPYYVSKAAMPSSVADDDIVIYPETVKENVLKAKNVVYWLLNKPGVLTGESISYQPEYVFVSYSTLVHEGLPQLFIMKDERLLFDKLRSECEKNEKSVSVYFGKVNKENICEKNKQLEEILKHYDDIRIITRMSPGDRENTLKTIAQSDLLISYDALTNLNYEATLLGTPVLIMNDFYNIKNTDYNAGKFGCAFDEKEIQLARGTVEQAYVEYCRILEKQDNAVVEVVNGLVNQLKRIKNDPQTLLENVAVNEKIMVDFKNFEEKINGPFSNINFPYEIPNEIKRIIRAIRKVQNKPVSQDTSDEIKEKSILYELYGFIKPKWVDATYLKGAADLNVYELAFLTVRRLLLFWKKK